MLDDAGQPVICDVSPEPGEPLTLIEAADLLRLRRRNARELSTLPIYRSHMASELRRYREGEHIASVQTLVAMRDEPGLNKAADCKVRVGAAMALLGEDGRGTNVTINNNTGPQIAAGIVIDLRDDDEFERDRQTIDHEDAA